MSRSQEFLQALEQQDISLFTGVPDSLMKGFIAALPKPGDVRHVITVNEGAAVSFAAGYHLATGNLPLVYLQNSGLGNIINPLTSLADPAVYGIPMLLMVGWRGRPGVKDEPQHVVMGASTPQLLGVLGVPYKILSTTSDWKADLVFLIHQAKSESRPVALLVEEGFFEETEDENSPALYPLSSEEAISYLCGSLKPDDVVICTTGKIGRVFYKVNQGRIDRYFLNVGSMGHAISIAAGVAKFQQKKVVVLDGDGSLLMHMGALSLPPFLQLDNFQYFLLNNGEHQSVGGQPTLGFQVDFCGIARSCGFHHPLQIVDREGLSQLDGSNTDFIEIRINSHTKDPLPRPGESPRTAKEAFMKKLGHDAR